MDLLDYQPHYNYKRKLLSAESIDFTILSDDRYLNYCFLFVAFFYQ